LHIAGHSHWQNIQKTKGRNDLMKSQQINCFITRMRSAARRAGGVYEVEKNKEMANLLSEFQAASIPKQKFYDILKRLQVTFHSLS